MIVFSVLLMNSWSQADSKDQKKRIKKRVAVFIFDDKTDKSWRWWNKKGVGEGIAEGAVTEFGYKKSDTGGRIKGIGLGLQSQSATVGIDYRMVNTTTAEIVAADNIRKEKSSKGIRVSTPKFSFKNRKSFDESLVGKAAREAVKDVIKLIDKNAPNIPWQAKIVTVTGG